MNSENQQEKTISFKDTLNLPRTDFPIRANAKLDDPKMLQRWKDEKLDQKTFFHNEGKDKFILHDGPPYANGHLHLGHAYNKILKDIVTKLQRMSGKHTPVTPGWDCHGLPIEKKVTEENPGLSSSDLKKACREYANKWINIQREEFKNLGVLMDWDNPYLTMSYDYESNTLRAFGDFVDQNYIERKNKTVPWCPTDQTVLASAEIEYAERKDPSVYVTFPLTIDSTQRLFPELSDKELNLLIWTTTPWTLPLNRAVMIKPNSIYVVLDINGKYIITAKELADKVCSLVSAEKKIVVEFISEKLEGHYANHPFIENLKVPILLEQSVSLEDGTACVHCAPGCGPEDYEVGVRNKLEIYSPISSDGKYTFGIAPVELEGMLVSDGQIWVMRKLAEIGRLFFKNNIKHSYPHCWRCHNGLIFRATTQWFLDLSKNNLREKSIDAINGIQMLPEKSANRLKAAIEGRLEWCISRQRVWGIPIPAIICTKCDFAYINKKLIDKVANEVANYGIEFWDAVDIKTLIETNLACTKCGNTEFKKETDILDVWFDSGVSHYAVLKQNPNLQFPADIYLEGKDQHRGWFQSSLLTSMILNQQAPMKTIVTHGFTVDAAGKKMSKSLGNIVAPQQMIDKLGTDGLRLWASSIDIESEAVVSDILLRNIQEVFFKIRNTCRFLISNLYDFDIKKDKILIDDMLAIDRYALEKLHQLNEDILDSYKSYRFTNIFHKLGDYCVVDLSTFYLDIIKDRLYVEKVDGKSRRSAQTACWYILDTLTKLIAPIMSFTAEQISDYYQKNKKDSIHLQDFNNLNSLWKELFTLSSKFLITDNNEVEFVKERKKQWDLLKNIRNALLKSIEIQREAGLIKHPLEAKITIYYDSKLSEFSYLGIFFNELTDIEAFFKEFLIVSQFNIVSNIGDLDQTILNGLYAKVERASGDKCPRCWQWGHSENEYKLCKRCEEIVKR